MAIVVVGGQSRKVGKTSVVCGLISALPELRWTAIKLTQHEPIEPVAGLPPSILLREEHELSSSTDSSRYLAAGAERAFWVRVPPGHLAAQMQKICELIASAENTILESNSILEFLHPDLALYVLNPEIPDIKPSAQLCMERADALLAPEGSEVLAESRPTFSFRASQYVTAELAAFVSARCGQKT
jgi:hypothetical protein